VARELRTLGHDATSGRDVRDLLDRGDADATEATRAAGRTIGEVLATVVSLLNPSTLVLGGDLASTALLAGVRETIYPRSQARATRHLDMRVALLGEDAGVAGLTRLLVEREFAAEAVNRRLGG
jgi:predicted NBD/HSP70 family sugar kinase